MFERLPITRIDTHPDRTQFLSDRKQAHLALLFERFGLVEPIVVRPHPIEKGRYQILHGHARFDIQRASGEQEIMCMICAISDEEAQLFLATINNVRSSASPENRMSLLMNLLDDYPVDELEKLLPERSSYLQVLADIKRGVLPEPSGSFDTERGMIFLGFNLAEDDYRIVCQVLDVIQEQHSLPNSAMALVSLAKEFLRKTNPDWATGSLRESKA